jgi:hypothetical protein
MFKTKSKKIQDLLFGNSSIEGGLPVVATMSFPYPNSIIRKSISWEGNRGLIYHLIERIEKLEDKVTKLESKKK